jgi:hypothetical protein
MKHSWQRFKIGLDFLLELAGDTACLVVLSFQSIRTNPDFDLENEPFDHLRPPIAKLSTGIVTPLFCSLVNDAASGENNSQEHSSLAVGEGLFRGIDSDMDQGFCQQGR